MCIGVACIGIGYGIATVIDYYIYVLRNKQSKKFRNNKRSNHRDNGNSD